MSYNSQPSRAFLAELTHILSHELRKPIGTMAGIVSLMEADLLTDDECHRLVYQLKTCLRDLDKHSRKIGDLINTEQSKTESS